MNNHIFPRGSEWRRWDLHAHTPLDAEWINRPNLQTDTQKKLFAEQYVQAAINAELALIAITEHNFCSDRDDLLIPYLQEAAITHDLTILPGFEVTVCDCGGTHVLVIFAEESSLITIDQVMSQMFPPGKPRFQGTDILPSTKGIEELSEILTQSKLNYLMLFAHADRENGVLWHRGSALRAQLWKQPFVKITQLSKPPCEYSGFIEAVINGTDPNYVRDISYVTASDCRSLDRAMASEERCALGDRYTWVKADTTLEGLKQIIFEPNARTCFQKHRPEEKASFLTIDHVRFLDSSGTFQSDPILLNSNLTTIIGGKSTGKSLLLSCIAHAIDDTQAQAAVKIAKTNLYDLGDLNFEVIWSTGDVDKLSESEVRRRVTFLPQMYIHQLVEEENRPSLSEMLLGFLRQNGSFEARYRELIAERDRVMTVLGTEISDFFSYLSSSRDIASKIDELGARSSIETEVNKIAEKAEELRKASGFTEEETRRYENLQQSLNTSRKNYKAAQRIEACMREVTAEIPTVIQGTVNELDEVVSEAATSNELEAAEVQVIMSHVTKLKNSIQAAYAKFTSDTSETAQELSQKTEIAASVLEAAELALKPFWAKIANQKELKELQESTKQFTSVLEQIDSQEKEKSQIAQKYSASVATMKRLVSERFDIQKQLIELFNDPAYAQIGDDTMVSAGLAFTRDRFESDFLGCFDLRHPLSRLGKYYRDNTVVWSQERHIEIIIGTLLKLIETPEDQLKLRSNQTLRNAVDILLRDYLSHSFTVKQAGEDIFKMSPGKQGLILLEIFLHLNNSRYPILIDQPEDNLDNRTIYSHLVKYIRKRKLHRQIIMVTHNPNLVLGTDAEQVIVANQDGQGQGKNAKYRFEYVSGAIECSFINPEATSILNAQGIREHVCHVLEGGREAFRKREEKYCFV